MATKLRPVTGALTLTVVEAVDLPSVVSSGFITSEKQSPFLQVHPKWVKEGTELYEGEEPLIVWEHDDDDATRSAVQKEGHCNPDWGDKA